jgi:hypothetical protein
MRPENAFPVEPEKISPTIMREVESVIPVWTGYVELRVKKKLALAKRELPAVEKAVCGLVRQVLQPPPTARDINTMYVVGMVLWTDGIGGSYTQEQKKNHVLFVVPELGRCAAELYEGVASHPTCVANYRRTLANTGRCSIHFYAQAIAIYKQLDLPAEAEATFDRAMDVMGAMGWQNWRQTPDLVVPGLRSSPWWEAADVPIARILEENHELIREDALKLVEAGLLEGAYPSLVEAGTWQKVSLFKKKRWDAQICSVASRLCDLLRPHMHIDVPWLINNQEEVVVFLTQPGSRVAMHNGGTNVRLNVHLGLSGIDSHQSS